MERLLQPFCVTENEETDSFKPVPVIVMMILILAFIAATVYVLVSSFQG